MSKKIKVSLTGLLMAVLFMGVGIVGKVTAASTDSIQLSVTPGVTYSVRITSATNYAGVAYNFGTVNLNATTLTQTPASVQNNGNVISHWQVSAYQETTWGLSTSTGSDTAVLKALFNATGGAAPTANDFNTVSGSTISTSVKQATQGNLSTSTIVNTIPVNAQRDLYFMLHTPSDSSAATAQTFRVYVTAVP